MKNRDHAGVCVPPPVIFALPLLVAALVHAQTPWTLDDVQLSRWRKTGTLTWRDGKHLAIAHMTTTTDIVLSKG